MKLYLVFLIFLFTFFLFCFQSSAQSCDSSRIASYDFNGNTVDITGHGYNLTNHGAQLTSDRFGTAQAAFQVNVSHYLDILTSDFPQLNEDFTISIWFLRDDFQASFGPIWEYGNVPDTCTSNFSFWSTPSTGIAYLQSTIACVENSNYIEIPPTIWQQAVLVHQGSHYKSFINGGLWSDLDTTFQPAGQSVFSVGRTTSDQPLGYQGFMGSVDDLHIYNCAMPDSEIQNLYSHEVIGVFSPEINPVSVYPSPTSGSATISTGTGWLEARIEVSDLQGRILLQTKLESTRVKIDLSSLNSGCYLISLLKGDAAYHKKIVCN